MQYASILYTQCQYKRTAVRLYNMHCELHRVTLCIMCTLECSVSNYNKLTANNLPISDTVASPLMPMNFAGIKTKYVT